MDGSWFPKLLSLNLITLKDSYGEVSLISLCILWKHFKEVRGLNSQCWRIRLLYHCHNMGVSQSSFHRSILLISTNQLLFHDLPSLPFQVLNMHMNHKRILYELCLQFLLLKDQSLLIMHAHLHLIRHYQALNLNKWCHAYAILQWQGEFHMHKNESYTH